jgi:predicted RNA binding protein YcfA (HicA-like mRNA interferase family)
LTRTLIAYKIAQFGAGMPLFEKDLAKIRAQLTREGWQALRNDGDHTVYAHPERKGRVIVPKGRGDLPPGTARSIAKQAGWI